MCSELSVEAANVQYFEGGSLIPNKSPGQLTFADVTLKRGATQDRDLMFATVATLRQQSRNVLDFVTAACRAANHDRPGPSLIR